MQEIIEDGESSEVKAVLNDERYQSFKVSNFTCYLLKMVFQLLLVLILSGHISSGCRNKMPQTGWIKQQIFIFL